MRLINRSETSDLETQLSARVVEAFGTSDQAICGGGPLIAGQGFEQLVVAYEAKQYLGVIGASIPAALVTTLPGPLRANLGGIWYLAERFFVADSLSREWGAHLLGAHNADKPKQHGYLAWLFDKDVMDLLSQHTNMFAFEDVVLISEAPTLPPGFDGAKPISVDNFVDVEQRRLVIIDSVGAAIALAILQEPCIYLATHRWGNTTSGIEHNLLVRWAREVNVADALCYDLDTLRSKLQQRYEPTPIKLEPLREKARELLTGITMQAAPSNDVLVSTFGPRPASKGRELKLGSHFNRDTHYDEAYFGEGIYFTRPDGTIERYQGPAHGWGGFDPIARWLRNLTPMDKAPTLLDLGCGAGSFVEQAIHHGFDAWGIDISAAAVAHSTVKDRLLVADVTKPSNELDRFTDKADVVAALDFWEHIFLAEIDDLAEGVRRLLKMNGRGFFCICTRASHEPDLTMRPDEIITKENSWLLVSGHVTIRRWRWWAGKFAEHGLEPDFVSTQLFQVLREEDPAMSTVKSWSARHTMFVKRTR